MVRLGLIRMCRGRTPMIRFRKGVPPEHLDSSDAGASASAAAGSVVAGAAEASPPAAPPQEPGGTYGADGGPCGEGFQHDKLDELFVPPKYKRRIICPDEMDQINRGGRA